MNTTRVTREWLLAMNSSYEIRTGSEKMIVESIYNFLVTSYWSKGISKEIVQKAIENSPCVGVFLNDEQIGFARATTDRATFAYIADVYILQEHRRMGLGKKVLDTLFGHPDLQGLRRMMLATRDAHSLYTRYEFSELVSPNTMMENWKPNVYSNE